MSARIVLPGAALEHGGQRYGLIAREPHSNRFGRLTSILWWESTCPDCGAGFAVSTAPLTLPWCIRRRCIACRKPGVRVRAAAEFLPAKKCARVWAVK